MGQLDSKINLEHLNTDTHNLPQKTVNPTADSLCPQLDWASVCTENPTGVSDMQLGLKAIVHYILFEQRHILNSKHISS